MSGRKRTTSFSRAGGAKYRRTAGPRRPPVRAGYGMMAVMKPARSGRIYHNGPAVQHSFPLMKSVDLKGQPVAQTISTTAGFHLLNGIQAGTGFFNRVGNRVTNKSLHLVGQIVKNTNTPSGLSEYLRVMVVYDKQANGAQPAIADLLLDTADDATTTTNSWSGININNRDRFQVLMDNRVSVANDGATAEDETDAAIIDYTVNKVNVNRYMKLNDLETMYKSSTNPAAIGDVAVGALWLVTFGNLPALNSPYNFIFNARLRYYDC